MNINGQTPGVRRRSLVIFSMSTLGLVNNVFAAARKPISTAAPFVLPGLKWPAGQLADFIKSLPTDRRLELKKSLELLPVAFTGFAFYTTMSVAIASVASALGVVLPFAVYGGAASLIGILSGPIGGAIMGVSAIGGMALAGRADLQKTTAFVAQIHALKVEASAAASAPEKSIF